MKIGILGGGQLGWMTILEGRKLGLSFAVLDPNPESPASRMADRWYPPQKVDDFLKECDVITYEFEHIEDWILEKVSGKTLPPVETLLLKKNKGREKEFLYKKGYPVPSFRRCSLTKLEETVKDVGLPAVVKSEKLGYDGKGQYRIIGEEDLIKVYKNHPQDEDFLVEELVDFVEEVSLIGVRDRKGNVKLFPPTRNVHEEGILLYNMVCEEDIPRKEIEAITLELIDELRIVGLLAVEFFITSDGKALINEIAPRPHNSGHYTLDGTCTSQFENLLRALIGLPLGSTDLKLHSGMVNILGLSLEDFSLNKVLSVEGTKLYWYGKEKRKRRKMGHVNIVSKSRESLVEKISELLTILYRREHDLIWS
ncbi:MAG TPA: 5-(carboxyamino)imidazole ribonucleotide synthase [Aquifex aeolicus]|nr:5-(carboxyamino)imidazole ribonucleotide synthase [Aquifex aeolicus]